MNIIKVEKIASLIGKGDTVIVDARGGADAYARFLQGHLNNSFFLDLEKDLSNPTSNPENGGRHPLPSIETFAATLGKLGIKPSTKVIIYDDKNGAMAAARFWWMLRAVGHRNLHVVSGGMAAIVKAGLAITTDEISPLSDFDSYPVADWAQYCSNIDQVAEAVHQSNKLVIDVREPYRYDGESEPIDLIAGHIPGAINLPYTTNLNEEGLFLEAEDLFEIYRETIGDRKPQDIIIHCGSGVTACHTLLALSDTNLDQAKLYVGSWSEWSRSDRAIAIK